MTQKDCLTELGLLGPLPGENDSIGDGVLERYEELLGSLKPPFDVKDAGALLALLPPEGCFGLEFKIVHLVETLPRAEVEKLYGDLPAGYWRDYLWKRAGLN